MIEVSVTSGSSGSGSLCFRRAMIASWPRRLARSAGVAETNRRNEEPVMRGQRHDGRQNEVAEDLLRVDYRSHLTVLLPVTNSLANACRTNCSRLNTFAKAFQRRHGMVELGRAREI